MSLFVGSGPYCAPMYDMEFGPAVVTAVYEAARLVLDAGEGAVPELRAAISRHPHEMQGFNKLHIGGEQLRDLLVRNCREWQADVSRRELVDAICQDAQWFVERY